MHLRVVPRICGTFIPVSADICRTLSSSMNLQNLRDDEHISDASIVILIWKVVEAMRGRGDGHSLDCLLNEEKLLHLTLMTLEKKTLKAPPFDITQEVVSFVQRVNRVTMEAFNMAEDEIDTHLFIKAVDLLMTKSLGKHITPLKVLGELKVLTFNNLACIYKRKKKFTLALRSVSFALEIEEVLVQNESSQDKHNIITTYLNKAAILSEMNKHQKAMEEINKGARYMTFLERENIDRMEKAVSEEEKRFAEEKRHYNQYMRMIILYNLGVENEHLNMKESAETYYRKGKTIAEAIKNQNMERKFADILSKLCS